MVVDPDPRGRECPPLTLARAQGLSAPSLRRTVCDVGALGRTHLEHTDGHVVTDRVCARDGIVVCSADVDDPARYRVSLWASEPSSAPVSKRNAPRTARAAEPRPSP